MSVSGDDVSDGDVSSQEQLVVDLVIEPRHSSTHRNATNDGWTPHHAGSSTIIDSDDALTINDGCHWTERPDSRRSTVVDSDDTLTPTTSSAHGVTKCYSAPCARRKLSERRMHTHRVTSYHNNPEQTRRPTEVRRPRCKTAPGGYRDGKRNAARRVKIIGESACSPPRTIADETANEREWFYEPCKFESAPSSVVSENSERSVDTRSYGEESVALFAQHDDVLSPPQQAVTRASRRGIMKVAGRRRTPSWKHKSDTYVVAPRRSRVMSSRSYMSRGSCSSSRSSSVERMRQRHDEVKSRGSSPIRLSKSFSPIIECVQQQSHKQPPDLTVDEATNGDVLAFSDDTASSSLGHEISKLAESTKPSSFTSDVSAPARYRFSQVKRGHQSSVNSHGRQSSVNSHGRHSGVNSHGRQSGINSHGSQSSVNSHGCQPVVNSHVRQSGVKSHERRCGVSSHERQSIVNSHYLQPVVNSHEHQFGVNSHCRQPLLNNHVGPTSV